MHTPWREDTQGEREKDTCRQSETGRRGGKEKQERVKRDESL
jgi:hypothetical protein